MNIERLTRFAIALEDLAKEHGFEAVENSAGATLWVVYSTDGLPMPNRYMVEFKDTK